MLTEVIYSLPLILLLEGCLFVGLALCVARMRRVRPAGGVAGRETGAGADDGEPGERRAA